LEELFNTKATAQASNFLVPDEGTALLAMAASTASMVPAAQETNWSDCRCKDDMQGEGDRPTEYSTGPK
jgi:hypothetical protein